MPADNAIVCISVTPPVSDPATPNPAAPEAVLDLATPEGYRHVVEALEASWRASRCRTERFLAALAQDVAEREQRIAALRRHIALAEQPPIAAQE